MTAADAVAQEKTSLAQREALLAEKVAIFGSAERYRQLLPYEADELLGSIAGSRSVIGWCERDPQGFERTMAESSPLGMF